MRIDAKRREWWLREQPVSARRTRSPLVSSCAGYSGDPFQENAPLGTFEK